MVAENGRKLTLTQATGIGVGAIVGGGILALAGVAFATTGPGALLAFALNGIIALLTALSFAEMASAFPESGGTYTFAKKVLSVQAAFSVGWVVWFASIVAAVLYALGFAAFAVTVVRELWPTMPAALNGRWPATLLAIVTTAGYLLSLSRSSGGGGQWINVGKVAVFAVLIAGGIVALTDSSPATVTAALRPLLPAGAAGLVAAMGYTFIALQGFDLIAAVAGEIRQPEKTVPRAMLGSLGIALAIYLPLLLIVATVGMAPGQDVQSASAAQPETIIASAARTYLGSFGYWLVLVAGLLSMLSALQANLFAASRVAQAMARDRTLHHALAQINLQGIPVTAVLVTGGVVILLLLLLPDVAAAGAASSLIFLVTFALAHLINMLMHQRSQRAFPFQVPWFPAVPLVGLTACLGLAIFQGIAVPAAGMVAGIWLSLGAILFLTLFARRAGVVDAAAEALNPELMRLRGRSPLVLVPIANPANAASLVFVANALTPPLVGRALLLSIVSNDDANATSISDRIANAQFVLHHSLQAALETGLAAEALTTIAKRPWPEIRRVAQMHHCSSLLLGLSQLGTGNIITELEKLITEVDSDVIVLRPPASDWDVRQVRRVLVPLAGQGQHDMLRARLLANLHRVARPQMTFLQILPGAASPAELDRTRRNLRRYAQEETPGNLEIVVQAADNPGDVIVQAATSHDLILLGLHRQGRQRVLGDISHRIAVETKIAMILINRS